MKTFLQSALITVSLISTTFHAMADKTPEEIISDIPKLAEHHVVLCKENFDVSLDYSPESIKALDEIISKHFAGRTEVLNSTILTFGSYLGETIRHSLGGDWHFDAEKHMILLRNIGEGQITISPFGRTGKRFLDGEEFSLYAYYETIKQGALKATPAKKP